MITIMIAIVACSPVDDKILFTVSAAVLSSVALNADGFRWILIGCECFHFESDSNDIVSLCRYRYSCDVDLFKILHTEKNLLSIIKSVDT